MHVTWQSHLALTLLKPIYCKESLTNNLIFHFVKYRTLKTLTEYREKILAKKVQLNGHENEFPSQTQKLQMLSVISSFLIYT